MSLKWQNLILALLIILFLFTIVRFNCLAQSENSLEVKYPLLNNLSLSATSTFSQYVKYIYRFVIWISGIVLMVIILSAGISYMTSAGNPAKMKDAKAKIISGIIGIIIIFLSYLLLATINPEIVGKEVSVKSPKIGIYLKDNKGNKIMVSDDIYNTNNFKGNYICLYLGNEELGKIRSIYIFAQADFQGAAQQINPSTVNGSCFASSGINPIKSVKIVWNLPGIYVWSSYKTNLSLPYLIDGTVLDLNVVPALSDVDHWDKIEIKGGSSSSSFGAILYNHVDLRGKGRFLMEAPNINNTVYNSPPYKSIYILNGAFQGSISTTLYSSPQFQTEREERDATGREIDRMCKSLPIRSPVLEPKLLSPANVGNGNLRSIKIAPQPKNKTLIILLKGVGGSMYSWNFEMAEPFTKSDPDLSDNYIGRCTSTSYISPWMDWHSIYHSCADSYMAIPIQK